MLAKNMDRVRILRLKVSRIFSNMKLRYICDIYSAYQELVHFLGLINFEFY